MRIRKGVLSVAAGNSNDDVNYYFPANIDDVITVATTDQNDLKCSFSNWGSKIDVAAPGGNLNMLSLLAEDFFADYFSETNYIIGGRYLRIDGTSMATPHVSAIAALIIEEFPDYTLNQIRQKIFDSADDKGDLGWDPYYGFGRVNAQKALVYNDELLAEITYPILYQSVSQTVTIMGKAEGANFAYYAIKIGEGEDPTQWTTNGITLTNGGNTQIPIGTLGEWDSSSFSNGAYTILLEVFNTRGDVRKYQVTVMLLNNFLRLQEGWPQDTIRGSASYVDSPIIIDIDGDGDLEILASDKEGFVNAWHHDGTMAKGWPVSVGLSDNISMPAIGDIDGDGNVEILVNAGDGLFAIEGDGYIKPGWPKQSEGPLSNSWGWFSLVWEI